MQVTNNSTGRLVLSDGQAIDAGQTVDVKDFDDKHHVTKAWLDAEYLTVNDSEDNQPKPLTKMKVDELQSYIAENGGEFAETDKKDDLLLIAQDIEEKLNDNQE